MGGRKCRLGPRDRRQPGLSGSPPPAELAPNRSPRRTSRAGSRCRSPRPAHLAAAGEALAASGPSRAGTHSRICDERRRPRPGAGSLRRSRSAAPLSRRTATLPLRSQELVGAVVAAAGRRPTPPQPAPDPAPSGGVEFTAEEESMRRFAARSPTDHPRRLPRRFRVRRVSKPVPTSTPSRGRGTERSSGRAHAPRTIAHRGPRAPPRRPSPCPVRSIVHPHLSGSTAPSQRKSCLPGERAARLRHARASPPGGSARGRRSAPDLGQVSRASDRGRRDSHRDLTARGRSRMRVRPSALLTDWDRRGVALGCQVGASAMPRTARPRKCLARRPSRRTMLLARMHP